MKIAPLIIRKTSDPMKPKMVPSASGANGGIMPLTGHLRELRNRVAVCLLVFFAAAVVLISYAEQLVTFMTDMGEAFGYIYVFIAPQELLMQYFKVALLGAVCITLPLILYQLWAFARPGLTKKENSIVFFALIFGLIFFCIGVYFAYRVTLPFMLSFLIGLNTVGNVSASISVESYLNFLLTVFTIFGLVFEMPVVSTILSALDIVTPGIMRKIRPVAIIVIFVVAAVITPPDIFSQVMVALPMLLLYELSIFLSMVVGVFKRRKAAVPE